MYWEIFGQKDFWNFFTVVWRFSEQFCGLSFLWSWFWFYIEFLAENLQFRSVCCRYEYDVVLRGTNVIIYARLRLDRYAKHTLVMFVCYMYIQHRYKSIIFRKFVLFTILLKNWTDFSAQQYCHVEFSFKFFNVMVKKGLSEND